MACNFVENVRGARLSPGGFTWRRSRLADDGPSSDPSSDQVCRGELGSSPASARNERRIPRSELQAARREGGAIATLTSAFNASPLACCSSPASLPEQDQKYLSLGRRRARNGERRPERSTCCCLSKHPSPRTPPHQSSRTRTMVQQRDGMGEASPSRFASRFAPRPIEKAHSGNTTRSSARAWRRSTGRSPWRESRTQT